MLDCDIIASTRAEFVSELIFSFVGFRLHNAHTVAYQRSTGAGACEIWNVDQNSSERQYVCNNYLYLHYNERMLRRPPVSASAPFLVRRTTEDNEYDIIKCIISFMRMVSKYSVVGKLPALNSEERKKNNNIQAAHM